MNLRTDLKAPLRHNVLLSSYATMQVGGPAQLFSDPSTEEELLEILDYARSVKIPFMILGKGSNAIFPDEGFPGLVITLIHYELDKFSFDKEQSLLTASAGIHLYRLCLLCRDNGIGGAEFLANIPGTLGGAVMMNAGFSRHPGQRNEIADVLESVTVLDPVTGKKETLAKKDIAFSYRHSGLEGKIVLSATLRLWKRLSEDIQKEIRANFDYRNNKQDLRHPSSGSIFKNPKQADYPGNEWAQYTAGQIVDRLGLLGTQVGGAKVSPKHGNYIINAGNAKSSDIVSLMEKIQKAVLDATGIRLEPEVKIIAKP